MVRLILVALFIIALCAGSSSTRVFSEDYIEGLYGRFFEFTKQGNRAPCPQVVDHSGRGNPSSLDDSWIVPHNQILQNGIICNDRGVLVLKSYDSKSNMPPSLANNDIAEETFNFMKKDSTGFWLGVDARKCGKWNFPNPSYIFFVKEFEKEIEASFNLKLEPGKKYMFVVAPAFTCIYEDIPRRQTPPTVVVNPAPPANGPDTSSSGVASGEDSSDENKPEDESEGQPDKNPDDDSSDGAEEMQGEGGDSDPQPPNDENEGSASGSGEDNSSTGPDNGDEEITIVEVDEGEEPPPPDSGDDSTILEIGEDNEAASDGGDEDPDQDVTTIDGEGDENDEDSENTIGDGEVDDGDSLCFPGEAKIELSDGSVRHMRDLAVGDEVRVGPDTFSSVFMFTHKMEHEMATFVQLQTASGQVIGLTPGHMLYANGQLVPAAAVRRGDMLRTAAGAPSPVVSVARVQRRGVYNPQTVQGDIVVDGIVASTYTTTIAPAIGHGLLTPLRAAWNTWHFNMLGVYFDAKTFRSSSFPLLRSSLLPHQGIEL